MSKQFASEYQRNEQGWIKFPRDDRYRKEIFPEEVNQHPAKANVFLVQSIIEYVSESGQTIMDIMAGTGTIMVGAIIGRKVICVEISPKFAALMEEGKRMIGEMVPGADEQITIINLPCQNFLPVPDLVDHIIFSPQYANIIQKKKIDKWTGEKMPSYDFAEYTFSSPLNLGTMSEFLWKQEMELVYKKCYKTIKAGGTLTAIVKDHMELGSRVPLSQITIDSCQAVGFKLEEQYKWKAPGLAYTALRRSRGEEVVEDEDIIILRKGG